MNGKLNQLATKLMSLYINEGYGNTWNEYIDMMETTLSLIKDAKENKYTEKDMTILKGLIKEALNLGLSEKDMTIKSHKHAKLYELTIKVKEEIEKFPYLKYQEEEITDFNSWIRSLKIFKMGSNGLEDKIYETSYELYEGMRKIILSKKSPSYKKIYMSMIVEKLEHQENKDKLPTNIKIEQEDYELYQIIKLVKQNNDLNYNGYNRKFGNLALTKARNLQYQTNANRVLMLINN